MSTVYYSLAPDANGTRERQWAASVRSLRRYNVSNPVVLCLYGEVGPEVRAVARETGTLVEPMGEYAAAFGDVPWHWRTALAVNPTFHKLLSLRRLADAGPLVYLDCDTYAFGDIGELIARYDGSGFCAREEPMFAWDGADHSVLAHVTQGEGLVPVRPYNTGVMLIGAALARTLTGLLEDFVWYAWRLLHGACLWQPDLVGDDWLVSHVRSHAGDGERRLALPYPAPSFWILEEVATWLTLGRVPGLAHAALRREDVAQNGECTAASSDGVLLAHYFTAGEHQFFASRLTSREDR